MEQNKKLSEIAQSITALEETQQGKLSGGFASFEVNPALTPRGSNTNNAVSCSCSNTNNATSCSCSAAQS